MRLLVVGHTYLTAFAQRKYVEMKRQCPGLELKILTPRQSANAFRHELRERAPEFSAAEVVDIREFFGRSHMSYVLDPLRFVGLLREFRPERVHIEEDPHSAIGVEAVFLTRLFCPSARISFFIWDNLARMPRFPLNVLKRLLSSYALDRAELVVCGNQEGERLLREKKRFHGRTAILPQFGLDPAPYAPAPNAYDREALCLPTDVPLIGFVGRLVPEKGLRLLLEALQRLLAIEWGVLITGSGPMEEEIASQWRQKLGTRLVFRPAQCVSRAEVPAYMRALDVLVLPSLATPEWKEQFGFVLAEAMMAGTPCIGSSSGAIPEVVGPGGLVFREGDAASLAQALERLLTDGGLRDALACRAQEFAHQRYTNGAVATAYLRQFGFADVA